MKISKLFHWLYASIMFLPLLVAPIFAIYSHRHTIDNYSVTVTTDKFVPLYESNDVNDWNDLELNKVYHMDTLEFDTSWTNGDEFDFEIILLKYTLNTFNYDYWDTDNETMDDYNANIGNFIELSFLPSIDLINCAFTNNNVYANIVYYDIYLQLDNVVFYFIDSLSLDQFIAYNIDYGNLLPQKTDYQVYEYQKGVTTTYDDTDIGSQFTYQMYNITDKYLNFDNVLNLGAINDWLLLNVFNGYAPLYWTIIWHFLEYWLLVSIFWLCFDVLIYVPQLAHRWLDKASLE